MITVYDRNHKNNEINADRWSVDPESLKLELFAGDKPVAEFHPSAWTRVEQDDPRAEDAGPLKAKVGQVNAGAVEFVETPVLTDRRAILGKAGM